MAGPCLPAPRWLGAMDAVGSVTEEPEGGPPLQVVSAENEFTGVVAPRRLVTVIGVPESRRRRQAASGRLRSDRIGSRQCNGEQVLAQGMDQSYAAIGAS